MGIDIGGAKILAAVDGGMTLNDALVFNDKGQGSANPTPGYSGAKKGGSTYYSAPSGWEINSAVWSTGLNLVNGVYTCPVKGLYALGYNGLHQGGSGYPAGYNTYGYSAFFKNGVMQYHVHWNMSTTNAWNTGGCSGMFDCEAGDTLALAINRAPVSNGPDVYSQNKGVYPDEHGCVWCRLVG